MTIVARPSRIEARLAPWAWSWAEREADAIAAHWARRVRERPAMFDGAVLLAHDFQVEGEVGRLALFEARFSQLLAFRDLDPPGTGALNVFAAAAPRGRDGGYLLGLMADHTANAGQLYFPCGTPDRADVRPDGTVDLAGSALRELAEETGLAEGLGLAPELPGPWIALRDGGLLGFLRTVPLAEDAATARARVLAHLAADPAPELADVVVVRGPADFDPRMPRYVQDFLTDAFATE